MQFVAFVCNAFKNLVSFPHTNIMNVFLTSFFFNFLYEWQLKLAPRGLSVYNTLLKNYTQI